MTYACQRVDRRRKVGSRESLNICCQYTHTPTNLIRVCNRLAVVMQFFIEGWYVIIVDVDASRTMWMERRSRNKILLSDKYNEIMPCIERKKEVLTGF